MWITGSLFLVHFSEYYKDNKCTMILVRNKSVRAGEGKHGRHVFMKELISDAFEPCSSPGTELRNVSDSKKH